MRWWARNVAVRDNGLERALVLGQVQQAAA